MPDLLIAAAAEEHGLIVMHDDADFDGSRASPGNPPNGSSTGDRLTDRSGRSACPRAGVRGLAPITIRVGEDVSLKTYCNAAA